jgi:hypothetical protein
VVVAFLEIKLYAERVLLTLRVLKKFVNQQGWLIRPKMVRILFNNLICGV